MIKTTSLHQTPDRNEFFHAVKQIVCSIPRGYVLTYGDVAALAGYPSHARMAGKILGSIGITAAVPCHRVVNSNGRPAPHWPGQIPLLKAEGIKIKENGCVDMKRHRWHPTDNL